MSDVRIVAQYISRCSMPIQGPISGDLAPWRTRQDALDALGRIAAALEPWPPPPSEFQDGDPFGVTALSPTPPTQ